jgi:PadR family transcriptional regulator PadR
MAKYDIVTRTAKRSAGRAVARGSSEVPRETDYRGLYAGLIRLHVLHHACKETIYGFAMIEELRRHGYEISAGTLYPILHGLEQKGLLTSTKRRAGGTERRTYRATKSGRAALSAAKVKVRELFGELFEDEESTR